MNPSGCGTGAWLPHQLCSRKTVIWCWRQCWNYSRETQKKSVRLWMSWHAKRREKQPLEYPSAGSTFKRPAGHFAGKLIQDAGLRGFTVGGAQVSEKHCGFVINRDHATSADILSLCRQVQDQVKAQYGVDLELEVKLLGEF